MMRTERDARWRRADAYSRSRENPTGAKRSSTAQYSTENIIYGANGNIARSETKKQHSRLCDLQQQLTTAKRRMKNARAQIIPRMAHFMTAGMPVL